MSVQRLRILRSRHAQIREHKQHVNGRSTTFRVACIDAPQAAVRNALSTRQRTTGSSRA